MELFGYLASIVMGLSLGLIGGGGSILTVPILVYLFKIDPITATGYSLFIVGLSAIFGSFTYIRKGSVDFKIGLLFAAPSFLGVYLSRAFLLPAIPNEITQVGTTIISKALLIMVVFAILMLAASYSMIKGTNQNSQKANLGDLQRYLIIAVEGLIVGGITGFVGAGGGFLIIPALVILTGLPMKKAVGTSLMIIAIKSLFGFLGDLKHAGPIDWNFLLSIAAIAVIGIFAGSYLSKYVPEAKLKKAFGYFVLIMGTGILIQQFSALLEYHS